MQARGHIDASLMSAAMGTQPDWSKVADRSHFVQFYEDDRMLVRLLSQFVGRALVSGDAAIVIAAKTTRERVAEHLRAQGYDVSVARRQRRYFARDVAATLRRVLRDGWPDSARFDQVIGALVD